MACPMCGSQEFTLLGSLGRLRWYRCRACGWNLSRHPKHAHTERKETK